MNPIIIVTLLVFTSVFLAFIGIHRWISHNSEMQQRVMGVMPQAEADAERQMLAQKVSQQLNRFSAAAQLERQLLQADSNLTVAEFLLIRVGATAGALLVGWFVSGFLFGGLILAVVGWIVPGAILSMQQGRRVRLFGEQLPDMLSLLVGSLRAGYGLLHACRIVCQEMPEPIAKEFSRVLKETSLGYSINDALQHLAQRIQSEDLELIVNAIAIQTETGGSLAEMLETISNTIRDRVKLNGEIRVLTSQQRFTGYILTGLPFGTFAIIMMLNPEYMMGIFVWPWMVIPIGALFMIFMGNLIMRSITKIEV